MPMRIPPPRLSAAPPTPAAARLLGIEGDLAAGLGLPADAFAQAIAQVGSYDDIFTRNLKRHRRHPCRHPERVVA